MEKYSTEAGCTCLDSAYERKAIDDGMNRNPVFPENIEYLKGLIMATHNLEDLLGEIEEDAVIEVLLDTNELNGLLYALAANYDDSATSEVFSFLRALQIKSNQIREKLVRDKYPLSDNNPNQ